MSIRNGPGGTDPHNQIPGGSNLNNPSLIPSSKTFKKFQKIFQKKILISEKCCIFAFKYRHMDTLYIHNNNGVCNISTDWKDWYSNYKEWMTPVKFEKLTFKRKRKYDSRI